MRGRIDRVEVFPVRVPNRIPLKLAGMLLECQENVIVRVWSGDHFGLGESEPVPGFQGCSETAATVCTAIRTTFTPLVIGEDPLNAEWISHRLQRATPQSPYAMSGLVNAIYDLSARQLGLPLYALLGGRFRDRIPVVWTLGIGASIDATVAEAVDAVRRGFRHLKLKAGGRPAEADIASVAAVRKAVGATIGLRIDANASLPFDEARKLLHGLQPLGLELAEQPLDMHDLSGAARLIEETGVRVMPDEGLHSLTSALAQVQHRAASIFGIKLAKHGGLHNARKIIAVAEAAGLPVYPGNQPSTSVGTATACHLFAAAAPASLAGDLHVGPAGWLRDDVVTRPVRIANGFVHVPEGPGIGMDLDDVKLAAYAMDESRLVN